MLFEMSVPESQAIFGISIQVTFYDLEVHESVENRDIYTQALKCEGVRRERLRENEMRE